MPNQSQFSYHWDRVNSDGNIVPSGSLTLPQRAWPTNNYNLAALANEKIFVGDTGNNLSPMNSVNPNPGSVSPGALSGEQRAVSHLRIMGLKFSGIDISSIALSLASRCVVSTSTNVIAFALVRLPIAVSCIKYFTIIYR